MTSMRRLRRCGGIDDLGCRDCDGSGSCPQCWGEGEHVEDVYVGPSVVTIVPAGGVL